MSSQTIPAPVDNERVLEQLEAEFLHSPAFDPARSEFDLAELLSPAVRCVHDDLGRLYYTKKRTGRYCCDA